MRADGTILLQSTESKSSMRPEGSQTTGGPVQLLNGIQETHNNLLDNLHNDGMMKLSNESNIDKKGKIKKKCCGKYQTAWPIRENKYEIQGNNFVFY